jgi:hypothetical protein
VEVPPDVPPPAPVDEAPPVEVSLAGAPDVGLSALVSAPAVVVGTDVVEGEGEGSEATGAPESVPAASGVLGCVVPGCVDVVAEAEVAEAEVVWMEEIGAASLRGFVSPAGTASLRGAADATGIARPVAEPADGTSAATGPTAGAVADRPGDAVAALTGVKGTGPAVAVSAVAVKEGAAVVRAAASDSADPLAATSSGARRSVPPERTEPGSGAAFGSAAVAAAVPEPRWTLALAMSVRSSVRSGSKNSRTRFSSSSGDVPAPKGTLGVR